MFLKIRVNRKGVSEMISYVLLIVIAVAISILVYAFVSSYVLKVPESCPDDTSLAIQSYNCYSSGSMKVMNVTIVNQGFHNVDGFMMYISNEVGKPADIALDEVGSSGEEGMIFFEPVLNASQTRNFLFDYTSSNSVKKVEIKPFRAGKTLVICKTILSQDITGC